MPDIIRLLPDHIANQIAAGEVIQRPASVVKELLENAIDAGANKIKVIIKDAGKSLIQVIDNGSGMTSTDARLSLERHATSKISSAEDLFSIKTKGFRGEALASIASVAQMEMKTKKEEDELGTRLIVHASDVKVQEPDVCMQGTDVSVRKLFFNIPARRKFLKSDTAEFRHIFSEFNRVVLAHPSIQFELHHNDKLIQQLPSESLLKRVTAVLGKFSKDKLILVEEETEVVSFKGFIGTAESARSRRDDQYLFINNRFFKSPYFGHAIASAYGNMLLEGKYPVFVLFLEVDPAHIDVNVHPTKQEVKFEDERTIYNYLKTAVRHGLAKHHMIPVMDFEPVPSIFRKQGGQKGSSELYPSFSGAPTGDSKPREGWESIFDGINQRQNPPSSNKSEDELFPSNDMPVDTGSGTSFYGYLIRTVREGIMLIHQRSAHIRILYEEFLKRKSQTKSPTQGLIFPVTLELTHQEASVMEDAIPILNQFGFDIAPFGQTTYVLHGVPAFSDKVEITEETVRQILKELSNETYDKDQLIEKMAAIVAKSSAIRMDKVLSPTEATNIVERLFHCELPDRTPSGQWCYIVLSKQEIDNRFNG